jgi:hypothetical protein
MRQQQQPQMALSRQRLLTLVYGDMETVRMVCTRLSSLFPSTHGSCGDASQAPKHVCGTVVSSFLSFNA